MDRDALGRHRAGERKAFRAIQGRAARVDLFLPLKHRGFDECTAIWLRVSRVQQSSRRSEYVFSGGILYSPQPLGVLFWPNLSTLPSRLCPRRMPVGPDPIPA